MIALRFSYGTRVILVNIVYNSQYDLSLCKQYVLEASTPFSSNVFIPVFKFRSIFKRISKRARILGSM